MEKGSSSSSILAMGCHKDDATGMAGAGGGKDDDQPNVFSCSICMNQPQNPIIAYCGHLFCWSCLHRWQQQQKGHAKPCPDCKFILGEGTFIPVYGCQIGRGVDYGVPPRPSATGALEGAVMTVGVEWMQQMLARQNAMSSLILTLKARLEFGVIRAAHPQSSEGWIAKASQEFALTFNPSMEHLGDPGPTLQEHLAFVSDLLVNYGEYSPQFHDFERSWLPVYVALDWQLSAREHYDHFMQAWCRHFHAAWERAGRSHASYDIDDTDDIYDTNDIDVAIHSGGGHPLPWVLPNSSGTSEAPNSSTAFVARDGGSVDDSESDSRMRRWTWMYMKEQSSC